MTRNFIRLPFAIALLLAGLFGHATTYYVSHNGSDSNSGTTQGQPWRNISRVQQIIHSLQPGDQILFERGGIYPGRLDIPKSGTSSQPIVVGAYGSGPDPIISGGEFVTNWVQHQGNIWRASFASAPKYVLVNNEPMTLARYPNHGWLRNVQGSTTHITSNELGQPNGYWNGAKMIVRTSNYSYESRTISSSTNGQINFPAIGTDLSNRNWGFYICGKLQELDMAGEWYYDAGTQQLYLWAPNNANPNSMTVLASIYDKGVVPGYQRSHIRIENLIIQGQTAQGISTEVSNNVLVTNCTIRHCFNGISSSGSDNQYTGNTLYNTFGAAINVYDQNTVIENNELYDIAITPGWGEETWGYWGINATNTGTVVRGNRLNNIGYIGIGVGKNVLVEKNVVVNAPSILNDGAGISFDHADGAIIRDNLVLDCEGDLESVASNYNIYYPIAFGIYFGNTSIKNTIVERNTVARCKSAGIHVDHSMASTGNQIKNNVVFDCGVALSISDFSNNHGPAAVPPYHVPAFNTVFSGNILYSIRPDQLCMRQYHVYSPNWVDFGSFNNNRYYNPYNEMSVMMQNFQGSGVKYHTLESWQNTFSKDLNSSRCPLRLSEFEVTQVLGSNQIANGEFNYNVNSWGGWPTQAQVTHSTTYLDNGAMKVNFNDNSSYDVFFLHPNDLANLQQDEYFRLKFSIQSNMSGTVRTEVKKQSQMQGPYAMFEKHVPFSPERRDMTIFFKSDATEQARIQWINHHSESTYWLDNVKLEKVQVVPVDPYTRHTLLYNDGNTAQTYSLTGCWSLIDGTLVSESITIPAFGSVVLQKEDEMLCGLSTDVEDALAAHATPLFHPNPVKAGNSLFLSAPLEEDMQVRLFDMTGRAAGEYRLRSGAVQFDLPAGITSGMYIVRSETAGGHTDQRIVVE